MKDEDGVLLKDVELIRERWVRWFHTLLNAKSPRLEPNIAEGLHQWPEYMSLGVQPTMQDLTGAIRSLANGRAVGPDAVSALRRRLLDIVVCIWRGGGAASVEIYHHGTPQKEGSDRVRQLRGDLAGSARRQDTAEDHHSPPQRALRARGDLAGGTESGFRPNRSNHRYDVCDSTATGVGAEETNSAVCMLYRPYQSVGLC